MRGLGGAALVLLISPSTAWGAAHCFIGTTDLPAGASEVPATYKSRRITISDPDGRAMPIFKAGGPRNERLLTIESVGSVQTDSFTAKYVAVNWMKPDRPGGFWLLMTNNGKEVVDQSSIFGGPSETSRTTVLRYAGWGLNISTDAAIFVRSICFADRRSELPNIK